MLSTNDKTAINRKKDKHRTNTVYMPRQFYTSLVHLYIRRLTQTCIMSTRNKYVSNRLIYNIKRICVTLIQNKKKIQQYVAPNCLSFYTSGSEKFEFVEDYKR